MSRVQRLVFGEVAELYDRRRPSYPEALATDVCPEPVDALEVGAGTGKATAPFVRRVRTLLALEPSPEMAAVIERRFAGEGRVEVLRSDFEAFSPGDRRFGLVFSAQAWHWVDAERRAGLAADVLEPGGVLAAFWNRPAWTPGPLRDELEGVLSTSAPGLLDQSGWRPDDDNRDRLWEAWEREAAATGRLGRTALDSYEWSVAYTTSEYLDLLRTQSPFRLLGEVRMEEVLAALGTVLDRHGGRFELPHLTWLCRAWRMD